VRLIFYENPKSLLPISHALPCFLANSNGGTLPDHKANILPHDRKRKAIFYGYDLRVLFFGKLPNAANPNWIIETLYKTRKLRLVKA